ncbi:hypothetical protein GBA52_005837 [Prunus armeniaca]|nr:hypothetical protein GBA52_005837 [Prunus armeniaca]
MATVVKSVVKAIRERGLRTFLKELKEDGYAISNKFLFDCFRQTKIHNIGARLVGVDKIGNKYYEKLDTQYGQHRWVEYAEKGRYNASQVPPEWHGWLHYITDRTGDEATSDAKTKRYGIEHKENFTGEGDEFIYHSKGHSLNPGQRDWTRYQPWQPTKP